MEIANEKCLNHICWCELCISNYHILHLNFPALYTSTKMIGPIEEQRLQNQLVHGTGRWSCLKTKVIESKVPRIMHKIKYVFLISGFCKFRVWGKWISTREYNFSWNPFIPTFSTISVSWLS